MASSLYGFNRLEAHDPVAPPLLWSEANSVLHETVWRGAISLALAEATRDRLLAAAINQMAPKELHLEAWSVAEALGWAKTYDAEYVALARLLDCRLLTVDRRLHRGVRWLVAIIGPTEL